MSARVRLFAASAASVLAFASQAEAQGSGANLIEELVVTAEKREQSLQDVPVAVSAFTSEKRELIGISTVTDMTNYTPGLTYSSGTDRITLRGIGRLTNNLASEPGVANYSDGVYSSSTVTAGASTRASVSSAETSCATLACVVASAASPLIAICTGLCMPAEKSRARIA